MELFSILFGIVFFPTAIIWWVCRCRRHGIARQTMYGWLAILVLMPTIAVLSVGKYLVIDEPLGEAVDAGDIPRVRQLLARGADPNTHFDAGTRALNRAAISGNAAMVRLLIAAGADVNAHDDLNNATPLESAWESGHNEAAKIIKAAGGHR
jgi:ankyrin repeat protein